MHQSGISGTNEKTIDMEDVEAGQSCQEAIITCQHNELQTTPPASPTTEVIPPEDQTSDDQSADTESLIHSYSCFKLSFIVKMACLQNIKAIRPGSCEEDVKREEQSMEEARVQAIKAWEKIRDIGVSYDVQGLEYLKSCTPRCDSASH